MYKTIIPRLHELQAESQTPISAPKCFYAEETEGVLIMENLKMDQFELIDKTQGLLKMSHVKLILTQLAEFHATTYHMIQTYEGGLGQFRKEFPHLNQAKWIEQNENMDRTFEGMIRNSCEVLLSILESDHGEEEPELYEKAKKFFDKSDMSLMDRVSTCHVPKEEGFSCLVHNDAWYNNFMFK